MNRQVKSSSGFALFADRFVQSGSKRNRFDSLLTFDLPIVEVGLVMRY